jgi:hypothetical protein
MPIPGTSSGVAASPWRRIVAVAPALAVLVYLAAHASVLTGGFNWLDHGDIGQGRVLVPLELARQRVEGLEPLEAGRERRCRVASLRADEA